MKAVLYFLQQNPIVIEVARQPAPPARDISIEVVLGIFATAGLFLAAAAVGSVIVAGLVILYKRWRDSSSRTASPPEPSHTRLGI